MIAARVFRVGLVNGRWRGLARMARSGRGSSGVSPGHTIRVVGARNTHARLITGQGPEGTPEFAGLVAMAAGGATDAVVHVAPAAPPNLGSLLRWIVRGHAPEPGDPAEALFDMTLTHGDRVAFVLSSDRSAKATVVATRAAPARTKAAFFRIDSPAIVSKHPDDSDKTMRRIIEAAARRAPEIVLNGAVDAIAPRSDTLASERQVERRVFAQLLTLLDGIEDRGQVVGIAATNMPDSPDQARRRPGRSDREIAVRPASAAQRREILGIPSGHAPMDAGIDLDALAIATRDVSGADIATLVDDAARRRPGFRLRSGRTTPERVQPDSGRRGVPEKPLSRTHGGGHAMTRSELVALMPGHAPAVPPDGCTIVRTDSHAAVLVRARLLPHARRTTVMRAAAGRARLLETLMRHGTVLPVLPGQRISDREIARLVAANLPALERLARRLSGTSQYQITVRWDAAGAVARLGQSGVTAGASSSLAAIAAELRADVSERLAATGADVAQLPVASDIVSNSVVLLDDRHVSRLDAALADIDALWSDGLTIRMIGPYPAVSFASLVFDRMDRPQIRDAQTALGLRSGFTDEAVRIARRHALMRAGAEQRERLRAQAELLACVARLGDPSAPVHVARIWSEGMSSATGTVARAA